MSDAQGSMSPARVPQAVSALAQLARRLGTAERLGPHRPSWLVAAVDQHAAAVRDALTDGRGVLPVVALAGYADGVLRTVARHGWILEDHLGRLDASWPLLRLLGVCALAGSATA